MPTQSARAVGIIFFALLLITGLVVIVGAKAYITDFKLTDAAKNFGFLILLALFVERAVAVLFALRKSNSLSAAEIELDAAQTHLDESRYWATKIAEAEAEKKTMTPPKGVLCIDDAIETVAKAGRELEIVKREEEFKASYPSVVLGLLISVAGVNAIAMFLGDNPFGTGVVTHAGEGAGFAKQLADCVAASSALDMQAKIGECLKKLSTAENEGARNVLRIVDTLVTGLLLGGGAAGLRAIYAKLPDIFKGSGARLFGGRS